MIVPKLQVYFKTIKLETGTPVEIEVSNFYIAYQNELTQIKFSFIKILFRI